MSQQCFDQQVSQGVTNVSNWELRTAEPAEPNKNHLFWLKYHLYRSFNDGVPRQLSLVINSWINLWKKKLSLSYPWRTARSHNWDCSHGWRITCVAVMLLRKPLLRPHTSRNSDHILPRYHWKPQTLKNSDATVWRKLRPAVRQIVSDTRFPGVFHQFV